MVPNAPHVRLSPPLRTRKISIFVSLDFSNVISYFSHLPDLRFRISESCSRSFPKCFSLNKSVCLCAELPSRAIFSSSNVEFPGAEYESYSAPGNSTLELLKIVGAIALILTLLIWTRKEFRVRYWVRDCSEISK